MKPDKQLQQDVAAKLDVTLSRPVDSWSKRELVKKARRRARF